ncbi:MAG: hypothetical protein HRT89_15530, partial [Lentisphaeria bacterium]|nr:hypothetical protein [Lentisphaeria bacterium]NQZ69468.1 hypothetical protein [Lentisphaeria bacterium]
MRKKYFFLLFILFINPLYAGDISIEFIAPDVDGKMKPLRDCRDHYISPDGLVVRDYLSGLTLEGAREERLLNRINRVEWETGVPSASLDTAEGEDLGDDFDDLDEELGLKKEKVRLVDPLYEKDQDVLPESFRLDKMSFDLDDGAYIINPGNLRFEIRDGKVKSNDPRIQIKAKRVIVTLMPIRFSVLYDGKKVNFKPELKFQKRDLMSEIRSFRDEYVLGSSPFLPKADGIVRQVYDLTLYLVPDTNYTFMGKEFSLGKKGIKSHDKTLGKRADYWLTWTTKKIKESIAKRVIPLSFMNSQQGKRCNVFHRPNVNAEISTDRKRLYVNAKEVMKQRIAANYSANTGEKPYPVSIIFLNPDYDQYPGRLLCFRNITGDPVVGMTLFSFKPEISKGQHEIRIETDAAGSDKLKGINQISAVVGGLGQSAELKWTTGSRTIRLIRKKKTNKWTFDTKELPQNFTLRFPELTDPGIWSELPFVKSAGLKGSLTIFANRGRRNYELGESIDLSLSIRGDADKSAVNWKLSHKGKVIWQKKDLQHLSIDSSSLSAGHYHMSAELSGYASYAFSFSLYTSEPYSDYPSAAIRPFSIVVPDKSISPLRHFFLADSGMASMSSPAKLHETVRGGRLHPGFAELLIASPLLPDLERTQLLTPYERSLEIATAEGARVYSATELKESYDSYNIPHTVVVDEKRMFRRMQHMVQRRRAYKSFGGLTPYWHAPTYGYREGSPQIYGHDKKRRDLIRELYEKKMKTPVPDKVPGILNNHYNGHKKLPLKKLKALNKERYGWELHQAELMASTYANWNRGIKAIGPYPLMMDNYSYWAITNTNYAPLVYSKDRLSLDWILSYNITDFGHMPFDTIYGTAISSLGADPRRPILTHAWSWGRQVMLEGLLAMSQGADCVDPAGGMGLVRNFGTFNETQQSSAGVSLWDRKMVGELFNRYGRMMGRLKPTNNVAIYMSMKQQWGPGNSHADRVWLFYRDLIRHRQIPALISDAELTIETLKKYKAVFLLGLNRPLDAEERKVLEAYKASGGRIFKDEDCPANLPGEKMAIWEKDFPKGKSAIRRMNMRAWLDHNGEKEFVAVHKRYLKIESELSRVFKMMDTGLITTDSYRTLLGQMTGDTVTLAVLLNKRLLPSEVKGHWRQLRNLPDNAVFNCAADSHVYDLFSGKKLQGKKAGKSQSFDIRFNQLEAALLLLLPSPIAELKVD